MMACLFWDPRGLGEDRKVNFIGNAIHDHNMFLLGSRKLNNPVLVVESLKGLVVDTILNG
jgi:hypothetical protein